MWFGTRDGLNKYDGYQITVYKNKPSEQSTISDNYIRFIYEDKQKELWIGTANGLNLYNRKTGNFIRFKHQPNIPGSISNNEINHIFEDSHGRFWVATHGGGLNLLTDKRKLLPAILLINEMLLRPIRISSILFLKIARNNFG